MFKYVGNIVIPWKHITKVELDHWFEKVFQDKEAEIIKKMEEERAKMEERRKEFEENKA